MRHYNKAVFDDKYIGCDVNFGSIMDEVRNEMRIETNYENPDNTVPETKSKKSVTKERFLIA